jgi:hypothetical protein
MQLEHTSALLLAVSQQAGIMETPLMMMAPANIHDGLMKGVAGPKRFGEAEEFALLVSTIIDNGYLNGEAIRLDGGMRFSNL